MSILENIKRRPLYTDQGYSPKSESAKNPSGHYTTSYQKAETTILDSIYDCPLDCSCGDG